MRDRRNPALGRRAGPAAGFTLVEVVVALLVLTSGVLGLAGSTAVMVRAVREAAREGAAAAAARRRIESLAARPCAALADGSARDGALDERWTVRVDSASRTALVTERVRDAALRDGRVSSYTTIVPC